MPPSQTLEYAFRKHDENIGLCQKLKQSVLNTCLETRFNEIGQCLDAGVLLLRRMSPHRSSLVIVV